MSDLVWVTVLGAVRAGRGPVSYDLGPAKQRALFAALALQPGEFLSIDTLLKLLWGNTSPPNAGRLLHTYIARLRRTVEPHARQRARTTVIRSAPGAYQLCGDVDLVRFRRLVGAARLLLARGRSGWAFQLLRLAVGLWEDPDLTDLRGLLPGHSVVDARRREWIDATLEYVALGLRLDQADAVLGAAERLAVAAPLHEGVQACFLSALAGTGRTDVAVDRYAEVRARLAADLGIAPGSELVGTYRRLHHDRPCRAAADTAGPCDNAGCATCPANRRGRQPQHVPAARGPRRDLEGLVRSLVNQRLVTVVGSAGRDGSALARAVAIRMHADFAHGVLAVDVSTVEGTFGLARRLLRQLDEPCPPGVPPDQHVVRSLAGQHRLLVFDDVDHHRTDDCANLVDLIIRTCRCLSVLVTARQPLALPYETVRRLPRSSMAVGGCGQPPGADGGEAGR